MIRAVIRTKNGGLPHQNVLPAAEMNKWVSQEIANNSWGKPDRWVRPLVPGQFPGEDVSQSDASRTVDVDGRQITELHFPADYTVELVDITAEIDAAKALQKAKEDRLATRKAAFKTLNWNTMSIAEVRQVLKYVVEKIQDEEGT